MPPPPAEAAERQRNTTEIVNRTPRRERMESSLQSSSDSIGQAQAPEPPAQAKHEAPAKDDGNQQPLDLSPQAISNAARRTGPESIAQAANRQLNAGVASSSNDLAKGIASGSIPDCLHDSTDDGKRNNSKPLGGLLALPYLVYSAATGKCK